MVFPAPLAPTMAVDRPATSRRLRSVKTGAVASGYEKWTF